METPCEKVCIHTVITSKGMKRDSPTVRLKMRILRLGKKSWTFLQINKCSFLTCRARERNRRRLSLRVPVRKGGVVTGLELHSIRGIGKRGNDKAGRADSRASPHSFTKQSDSCSFFNFG